MKKKILPLTETAVLVAFAIVLELLKKAMLWLTFPLPQQGSIWFTMVPLIIIGLRHGLKWGILGGLSFGVVNYIIDGASLHWASFLIDYLAAFGVLGLSGLFYKKRENTFFYILAFIVAGLARWFMHGISGVLLYGSYAPEQYANAIWFYSFFVYNMFYMLPSIIISVLIGLGIKKVALQEIKG